MRALGVAFIAFGVAGCASPTDAFVVEGVTLGISAAELRRRFDPGPGVWTSRTEHGTPVLEWVPGPAPNARFARARFEFHGALLSGIDVVRIGAGGAAPPRLKASDLMVWVQEPARDRVYLRNCPDHAEEIAVWLSTANATRSSQLGTD
jgi:hypothetical protein